jgi:hypothetical protein
MFDPAEVRVEAAACEGGGFFAATLFAFSSADG